MSILELRKRLIGQIQKSDNADFLQELFRFIELGTEEGKVYKLSDGQRNAINEGSEQIKSGQFLTDAKANKDIDEWLGS